MIIQRLIILSYLIDLIKSDTIFNNCFLLILIQIYQKYQIFVKNRQ